MAATYRLRVGILSGFLLGLGLVSLQATQADGPQTKPARFKKAHETTLTAGQEFYANTQASLRCSVHGVRSMSETVPHPDSDVTVRLLDAQGKASLLYKGKTDKSGL